MSCLDGNCAGSVCKPDLSSPHMPPRKSGWRLVGFPDFVPQLFQEKYPSRPIWEGNDPDQVLNQLIHVLVSNGISIIKTEMCAWANAQWCAADPDRCKASRSKDSKLGAKRNAGLVADSMQWASAFWNVWNVAITGNKAPDREAAIVMDAFIANATTLVNGAHGCTKCARHFKELLIEYPPGKINTWKQARVWLWRVHNESRDSKRVVPYYDIARIYGWEQLDNGEVLRIINNELRA